MVTFELLPEIPMDKTHSLDQMTGRFQSVKDGLPELIKNSKDAYARRGVADRAERQIVVIANTLKQSLGVLDFAGADVTDFDGWQYWSSRTASRAQMAADIEGGHGNGGKSFMVRGSILESYMDSCYSNRRTSMGFDNSNSKSRYIPGYCCQANGKPLRDVNEKQVEDRLEEALEELGLSMEQLPNAAKRVFSNRRAFTIVSVCGVRDWLARRKKSLDKLKTLIPHDLIFHAQAALTIESCSVWVIVDNELVTSKPLEPVYPDPLPGLENIPVIPVPQELIDPRNGDSVDTGAGDATQKRLVLHTSDRQLRLTDGTKAINVVRVRNARNIVANLQVANLVPRAESGFIFGDLRIPALEGDHLADSHRSHLADTPLARAIEQWTAEQIDALAGKIQKVLARETKTEEREKANEALHQFRDLMREYLESDNNGEIEGDGRGGSFGTDGRGKRRKKKAVQHGSKLDTIVLESQRESIALATGTNVPLFFRCYETVDGKKLPVYGATLLFCTSQENIVVAGADGTLEAKQPGRTEIWLRDEETETESNHLTIEVVTCTGVDITTPSDPLMQGQRVRLPISFQTSNGPRDDILIQGAIDESEMGRLSRHGMFTAGMLQGTATIRVSYGPTRTESEVATVEIGPDRIEFKGRGGDGGSDIPHILLCGDEAPNMDEYPKEMRTHVGGDRFPTIIEEPQFPNVVWINQDSKEALQVRHSRGGSTGIGGITSKTFNQFLSLKCFEILKRLKVRQEIKDKAVTEIEYSRALAQAEMDCAGFIDASYVLAEELYRAKAS